MPHPLKKYVKFLPDFASCRRGDSSTTSIRPISYAFDPVGTLFDPEACPHFSFLREALSKEIPGLENTNHFDPRAVKVPWPTHFPAVVQCKYWKEAEEAALELMKEILAALSQEQGLLPEEMLSSSKSGRRKYDELLETAVTAPMNMFPAANLRRAQIMAKANLLIFMHDDVVESLAGDNGKTIIDDALTDLDTKETTNGDEPWKNQIFKRFAKETIEEDPVNGKEFLEGILLWVQHTRLNPPKDQLKFGSFHDYVEYRIRDFAVEFCDAAMKLTCNIDLPAAEFEALNEMHRLYMMHFSLTNDLYSYPKEYKDMVERGTALVNAVKVLQDLHSVSPQTAKALLRVILWDLEIQIDGVYHRLLSSSEPGLTDAQARFARGMLECLAGNTYYSATTSRYASAVPGCAIKK